MNNLPSGKNWHLEYVSPELIQAMELASVVYTGSTKYQQVMILETEPFGRTLVLDGKTQSAERDEFIYHESLVHPAMLAHPLPQNVFIAGGGEGATAREILRHSTIQNLVMVDLDSEVVELCRRYLPNHHQGAFDDPRLSLFCQDALAYLNSTEELFDIIFMDISDPLDGGPAYKLYTQEFYHLVKDRLAPGGMVVIQSGASGPDNASEVFTPIRNTVASIYEETFSYCTFMPSFGTSWGFVIGCLGTSSLGFKLTPEEIDERLFSRVQSSLQHYDGTTHAGMFALPKYLRDALISENRLITESNPIFSF